MREGDGGREAERGLAWQLLLPSPSPLFAAGGD